MSKLTRPMSADDVIESITVLSKKEDFDPVDQGMKGAIIGIIDSLLGSRESRNFVLFLLFPGKWGLLDDISSKDLSEGEWYALRRWVGPNKPEGEKWQGSLDFVVECAHLNSHLDAGPREKQMELQEKKSKPSDHEEFIKEFLIGRFGVVPEMSCGHGANELTALFNPFCNLCCDGGKNKEAYKIAANEPLKEIAENGNLDQ